jgi:hypothetical protein
MTAINTHSPLRVTPLPNGYQRSEKTTVSLQLPELKVLHCAYAMCALFMPPHVRGNSTLREDSVLANMCSSIMQLPVWL